MTDDKNNVVSLAERELARSAEDVGFEPFVVPEVGLAIRPSVDGVFVVVELPDINLTMTPEMAEELAENLQYAVRIARKTSRADLVKQALADARKR